MDPRARRLIPVAVVVASVGAVWGYVAVTAPRAVVGPSIDPVGPVAVVSEARSHTVPAVAPRVDDVVARAQSPSIDSTPFIAPAASNVVLSGVATSPDGSRLAIVSVDRSPETLLRIGDRLGPDATVVRIDDTSMTYRLAGSERRVLLKATQNASATPARSLQASPTPTPAALAGAPAMARSGQGEPGSGNEAFRAAVAKKMQGIAAAR